MENAKILKTSRPLKGLIKVFLTNLQYPKTFCGLCHSEMKNDYQLALKEVEVVSHLTLHHDSLSCNEDK